MSNLSIYSFGYKNEYPQLDDEGVIFSVEHFPSPKRQLLKYNGKYKYFQENYWYAKTNALYEELKKTIIDKIIENTSNKDLKIFIGCSMGKHRSVCCVERLANDDDIRKMFNSITPIHIYLEKSK